MDFQCIAARFADGGTLVREMTEGLRSTVVRIRLRIRNLVEGGAELFRSQAVSTSPQIFISGELLG